MSVFFIGPTVGILGFDASLREDHSIENRISDNPVEAGGVVTDHVMTLPRVLALEVIQTLTPDSLLGLAAGVAVGVPPSLTRHIDTYNRLIDLAESRQPFAVFTSLAIYRGMVIERLAAPRTAETTNALIFRMELRQVEISIIDTGEAIAPPAVDGGLGEQDLGLQGTQQLIDVLNTNTVNVGVL